MTVPYFSSSDRTAIQTAVASLPVSTSSKAAALVAFDDLRLAEVVLRTSMGDITASHDLANISFVAYLIAEERIAIEQAAVASTG